MDLLDVFLRTLLVGGVATVAILPLAVATAYLLARKRFPGRRLVQALVTLPLVLPPVAVGLGLLLLFGRGGPFAGLGLLFTWRAAALAAAVVAFPLLVRSAEQAFHEVPRRLEEVARTLGASPFTAFLRVTLPLARRGIVYGAVLGFVRAAGEFGATMLVAGNIEGRTRTLALGIYTAIQTGDDRTAMILAGASAILALGATWAAERWLRGRRTWS